ncbi:phage holin [Alkalihalobacillus trypoxylicola]|uniref:Holin n=1 Tax=Alkalihalobacillus trypoxylicola TaxID=519424 RepID=A0A161PJ92_9BACI|nr:phage holin [Alkalihalobacillus trypoxylicola]KYG33882.1 holin [Alkalihalobacillus trypoxylicola]
MDKGTFIRTIVLLLALVNQILTSFGLTPVPGDEVVWYEIISTIVTAIAASIAWFNNNYVTEKGKKQKEVLQEQGLIKVVKYEQNT